MSIADIAMMGLCFALGLAVGLAITYARKDKKDDEE
jgi:hypothetical protein